MARNYLVEERRKEKQMFRDFIVAHPELTLQKIIGLYSFNNGYREKTLLTWIEELEHAGIIELSKKEIDLCQEKNSVSK